jgi:hypothetical protein
MALTKDKFQNSGFSNKRANLLEVDFDASYPTGGEALTPNDFGLSKIEMMIIEPNGGYVFEYDATNSKIKAFWVDTTTDGAPLAEVVDTTDLSGVTGVKCLAIGY